MKNIVKIPVRALVEYVYRSGSIETGFRTAHSLTEGTKAHRGIQQTYKETDRKEVQLQEDIEYEELLLRIEGRCDGLLFDGDEVTVDEIKSTVGDVSLITAETYPVHWAQAKCYAYIYARQERLSHIRLQLTYVQLETERQQRFIQTAAFVELEAFIFTLVAGYAPFARLQIRHADERNQSIKALSFPYAAYRQGQRTFAGAVYKSIADQKRLFAKAPTGTGKTMSTLFPAVKAIGEGVLGRFFYLTAKTLTRTAAEEALKIMESKGLQLRSVTLTAKEKVCFQEEVRCQKEFCEFADGYYDRINDALLDLLGGETMITRTVLEMYARKHRVCPFEFSLDAAYAADAVICDYNYIFDPRVSLKRLFEEQKRQTALLVDEAHNLVDRGRDMFSAELLKAPFLQLRRAYKELSPAISQAAKAVNDYFIAFKKANEGKRNVVLEGQPADLLLLLEGFAVQSEQVLAGVGAGGGEAGEAGALLLETYFAVQSYIRIAGLYDERFVTYAEFEKNDVRLKLFCMDPSAQLRQMGKGYRSQAFFSATLSPLSYYREMLGGEAEDYTMTIPSPFQKEQLEVLISPLSTRYRDREGTKGRVAELLHRFIRERPGNYFVFFPSYDYLNEVHEQFLLQETPAEVIVQQQAMSEKERESFLAAFQSGLDKPLVGFAVMGGIFSEGIDLTGDRLTGVMIVGVGLPQIGLERDLIKEHFDREGRNGFDYAYVYPGMHKVMQAGGRLIRTEQDKGTLILVDDRFMQPKYQQLLPGEWKPMTILR